MNWINYSFLLLSAIFYLFHTLHQAKYLFYFLKKKYLHEVESQTRLSIDPGGGGVKGTSEERLNKFKLHLMMPMEARQKKLRAIKYLFTVCP